LKLALVGYGNVARAFARLIEKKRAAYPFRIVGAHTRHGTAYDEHGLPVEPTFGPPAASVEEFLDHARAEVMVELSVMNPLDGQPALSHIHAAFARGMHVVTANKGPVACAYAEVRDAAARAGVEFRHEGVVMDGTPVFNLVRNTLPGVTINGFAGALNSTTKVILAAMARGLTLGQGIAEAQQMGLTEADPWFDIDGWDSACKAAALANVLMDARTNPSAVDRKGISQLTPDKLADAAARGKRVVLVSRARRTASAVKLRVRAEVLDREDPLALGTGTTNVLMIDTDLMGQVGVFTIEPGVEQTAYGVFSDLVDVVRSL